MNDVVWQFQLGSFLFQYMIWDEMRVVNYKTGEKIFSI